MDGRQFLNEFEHMANAPHGVGQLRELVLRLAIQGRLAAQNPSEESVADFLFRMPVPEKTVQRRSRAARTEQDRKLLTIPKGWATVQLHRLAFPQAGFAFKANLFNQNKQGLPIIRVRDVGANSPRTYFSGEYRDEFIVDRGDWLVAMDGDFRVEKWEAGPSLLNQRVSRLKYFSDEIDKKFISIALQFELRKLQGVKNYTTVDHLSGSQISDATILLPPIVEQARIVAKVDELMNMCAKLEQQQRDRRRLQNTLRQSSLRAVANAQSPLELEVSWKRIDSNFQVLFAEQEDVRQLRDVLCDLALRGVTLSTSKMGQGEVFDDTKLRPLSNGWEWKPLAKLAEYITSGSRGWKKYVASEGDSFIRSQDIKHDELIFENPAFVSLPDKAEGKRTLVQSSDLLITITGGNVGRCAVVPSLSQNAYVSQHVALIRLFDPKLSEFIHFWMVNAFGGQAFLARYIYGEKPGLNLKQVGGVLVPVPPIEMLPEILHGLRSNHQMCENLSNQLKEKLEVSEKLVRAAVNSITGISLVEEGPATVKAPQTELIAPLRLGNVPDATAQAPLTTILARQNGELPARDLWQRFGGEIDAFYAQLKTEVAHGWIAEPAVAEMLERPAEAARA